MLCANVGNSISGLHVSLRLSCLYCILVSTVLVREGVKVAKYNCCLYQSKGLLKTILSTTNTNMGSINLTEKSGKYSTITFLLISLLGRIYDFSCLYQTKRQSMQPNLAEEQLVIYSLLLSLSFAVTSVAQLSEIGSGRSSSENSRARASQRRRNRDDREECYA